jgi:hypothetical protein
MRVVKSEWHQVERRYGIEIDADVLNEIYPDYEEEDIESLIQSLESGEASIEDVINDAWENDIDLDWDWLDEDDWWTDRKGGYEVTYKVEENE